MNFSLTTLKRFMKRNGIINTNYNKIVTYL